MCIEKKFLKILYLLLTLMNSTGSVYLFALLHVIVAWLVVVLFYCMFIRIIEWTMAALKNKKKNNHMFTVYLKTK